MSRGVLRGTGPAPAGYVRCASPECSAADDGSHYHPQVAPELVPAEVEPADHRPGFYYVSAIRDDGRKALVKGPFPKHREALQAVEATKTTVGRFDPRAPWYAWGTARSEVDQGPGILDCWEASKRELVDDRDVGRADGEDDARDFG